MFDQVLFLYIHLKFTEHVVLVQFGVYDSAFYISILLLGESLHKRLIVFPELEIERIQLFKKHILQLVLLTQVFKLLYYLMLKDRSLLKLLFQILYLTLVYPCVSVHLLMILLHLLKLVVKFAFRLCDMVNFLLQFVNICVLLYEFFSQCILICSELSDLFFLAVHNFFQCLYICYTWLNYKFVFSKRLRIFRLLLFISAKFCLESVNSFGNLVVS